MMLKFGRIAAASTGALTLAAASIPAKAKAADLFTPRGPVASRGPVAYGGGGCGCQVYAPPPCCAPPPPPPCCVYGGDWGGGGYYGGGYGGGSYYGS